MDASLFSLVLPVALFIITLVIILLLRAEDKKSRSLQTVKEKIVSFRNEAQQTMVRIQETCHDCVDKINNKRAEAEETIRAVDMSLEKLKNYKRDLAQLEDVCKSYEVALENLKIQTEHAESRISVVQKEVEKAESISSEIEAFKVDAVKIEDDLRTTEENYRSLVVHTDEQLQRVAEGHVEKEKELLKLFSDELSRNREEFGAFVDEMRNDITQRKAGIDEDVAAFRSEIATSKDDLSSAYSSSLESLKAEHAQMGEDVSALRSECTSFKSELEEYFQERMADSERAKTLIDESCKMSQENMQAFFDTLRSSLAAAKGDTDAAIEELKRSLDEKLASVSAGSEAVKEEVKREEEKLKASLEAGEKELSASLSSAFDALKRELENASATLSEKLKASLDSLSAAVDKSNRSIEETEAKAVALHRAQKELIVKEEGEYVDACITSLRKIMAEEVAKIDGIFKSMSASASASIANLGKRQSEIKEAVSLLNQGTNETIAATVDRLQNLEIRLNQSEATLSETQKQVTSAKEELYNLQSENRSLQAELLQSSKSLEDEQNKLNETKNNRMAEEARVVKLKMVSEKSKSSRSASREYDFDGDEEELLLDDDN